MFKPFRTFEAAFSFLCKNSDNLLFLIENFEEYAKVDGVQYIVCCEETLNHFETECMYFEILETN